MQGTNGDLAQTLYQVASDVQRLEILMAHVSDSLHKRSLQLPPDVSQKLDDVREGVQRARSQGEDVLKQAMHLQNLVRASAMITTSLELDQVLQDVMDSVISLTGAERAYLMLREGDDLIIRAARNWDRETVPEEDANISRSVVAEALSQAQPILTTNAQDDIRFGDKASVISFALRSILCLPLLLDRGVVGVLYLDNRVRTGLFTDETVQTLLVFASQAAIAIEKARLHSEEVQSQRLEKELSVAREIQISLLPKACPVVPGWDFAAVYQPARLVGGDFYDFFELSGVENQIGIVIADVADKGVPAALFMALSRTMIRTTALSGCNPAQALTQANELILQDSSRSNIFLSAFYAALNTQTGQLVYANAGHNPPYLYRAHSGEFETLTAKGIVLGLFEGIQLIEQSVDLEVGDLLIFYTDGVTEAMDPNGREFGEERLRDTILNSPTAQAQSIADSALEAIQHFREDAAQSDDVTLVIVRWLGD